MIVSSEVSSEPTTPLSMPQRIAENEESIYEELCYITFRIKKVCHLEI